MAIIIVPTMAAFENDICTNLSLLEKIAKPRGHELGLEVIGKPAHFLDPEQRAKMVANLKKYAAGLTIVSHQWSGNIIYDPSPENAAFSDLRTERGVKVIQSGISFAEEAIAARVPKGNRVYVHTHGGDLYFGAPMFYDARMRDIYLIRQSLVNAAKDHPNVRVGLENLPIFPNSDDPELMNKPEKVGRTVFHSLQDHLLAVKGTDLGITFDPSHYAYDLEGEIDLVTAVDIFRGYLMHFHIGYTKGLWVPGKSIVEDGFVPGDGKIGIQAYERLFRHLKDSYDLSRIGIEAEVRDTKYSDPVNRKEAVRRIVNWLG